MSVANDNHLSPFSRTVDHLAFQSFACNSDQTVICSKAGDLPDLFDNVALFWVEHVCCTKTLCGLKFLRHGVDSDNRAGTGVSCAHNGG